MIPSVTCEACHGPSRAHVDAARRSADGDQLSLPMGPGRWTAQSQLELCGKCHRHPTRVPPQWLNPDDPGMARFQPIGLSQSRCYQATGGGMTCLSCHDPHARSSSQSAPTSGSAWAATAPKAPTSRRRRSLEFLVRHRPRPVRSRPRKTASVATCRELMRASTSCSPITGSGSRRDLSLRPDPVSRLQGVFQQGPGRGPG